MLPPRFLRHAPLLFVDSPAQESLKQIYGAFNSALLKLHPPLRGHVEGLTNAMIEFYHLNQVRCGSSLRAFADVLSPLPYKLGRP